MIKIKEMKKFTLILTAMISCQIVFGQLKVVQNGNVGIGTNNPQQKLQVEGNTYLIGDVGIGTSAPQRKLHVHGNGVFITGIHPQNGSVNILRILPNNPSTEIGSSKGLIDFWYTGLKYIKIHAKNVKLSSDSTLKEDIQPLNEGLSKIMQLNTYSYYYKDDTTQNRKREFGILAQEIESILPELVDTSHELMLVDYNQFIPFLINAIKEQQMQIEMLQQMLIFQETDLIQLRDEMMVLRADLDRCCEGKIIPYRGDTLINYNDTGNNPVLNEPVLYQNIPNPFNTDTRISYYLPATVQTAYLYIYNLNGTQLKSYTLTLRGVQAVTVYASELPAGMYLYTLVVDNVIIDSKRMILTK